MAKNNMWVIALIAIFIVGGIWYYMGDKDISIIPKEGQITPEPSPQETGPTVDLDSIPQGDPDEGEMISVKCYDKNKQLISCSSEKLFAIFGGTPGVYFIKYFFRIDNTGNLDLNAYIKQLTCKNVITTTSDPECENSFSLIKGESNKKLVLQNENIVWEGDFIELQNVPSGDYELFAEMCAKGATDSYIEEVCKTKSITFNTVKEEISFDINIGTS